ncbi:MAG: hypothetical protein LAT57_13420 [Balneolales bacterium]|nr:hypothetical protein [Balneolales bacterium]
MSLTHTFHIPVMGTGHSIDTPIRVAPWGIDSVISIVDDLLVERIRKHYATEYNLPFSQIARNAYDGRARRITAYLDTVQQVVQTRFDELKNSTFSEGSPKHDYFAMLPDMSPLKAMWKNMMTESDPAVVAELEQQLTQSMKPGSIDVNIMSKVDFLANDKLGKPLSSEFSDACAALRGYAESVVESAVILSAGFNPRLYGYIANFPGFYRDTTGHIKKKIVLKVSDFRSALIQGKFLAKYGLEISEFRIESGLNCGGHAFYSDGRLLPAILEEFRDKKDQLNSQFRPMVVAFYEKMGWEYPIDKVEAAPKITIQGGIGNYAETLRMLNEYDVDATGWGSPFLVVPEATCVDDETLQQLINAGEDDLYLSNVSPLGVPFNNLRMSGSEKWTSARKDTDKPGSACPKGFLKTNTEFTESPICTASTQYQLLKIAEIQKSDASVEKKSAQRDLVLDKACLCDHLGNGSLIKLGIIKEHRGPQAVCPGPNLAWFKGPYSLRQMVDHIYGRGESLTPENRPHVFAKELEMNVDYLDRIMLLSDLNEPKTHKYLLNVHKNLLEGLDICEKLAGETPYKGENLDSLKVAVERARTKLEVLMQPLMATA